MESVNVRAAEIMIATSKLHPLPASSSLPPSSTEPDTRQTSRLLDLVGSSISLKRLGVLNYRISRSATGTTKSERSVKVNSTFALRKVLEAGFTLSKSEKKISSMHCSRAQSGLEECLTFLSYTTLGFEDVDENVLDFTPVPSETTKIIMLQLITSSIIWKAVPCTKAFIRHHLPGFKIRIPERKISKSKFTLAYFTCII